MAPFQYAMFQLLQYDAEHQDSDEEGWLEDGAPGVYDLSYEQLLALVPCCAQHDLSGTTICV